jgi:hypothetical protein
VEPAKSVSAIPEKLGQLLVSHLGDAQQGAQEAVLRLVRERLEIIAQAEKIAVPSRDTELPR